MLEVCRITYHWNEDEILTYILDLTYADLLTAQPFGNTVDIGDIQGKYLKELFEFTTKEYNAGRLYSSLNLIQLSGKFIIIVIKKLTLPKTNSYKINNPLNWGWISNNSKKTFFQVYLKLKISDIKVQ